jgi:hypothetical protein
LTGIVAVVLHVAAAVVVRRIAENISLFFSVFFGVAVLRQIKMLMK